MLEKMQIWGLEHGVFPIVIFILIMGFMFAGFSFGKFRLKRVHKGQSPAVSQDFVSAIFGLAALLIAFTFSTALAHFDQRRTAGLKEVAVVSSAYESAMLLSQVDQSKLQNSIRSYLDDRIALYDEWENLQALEARLNSQRERLKAMRYQAIDAVPNAPSKTRSLAESTVFSSIDKVYESFRQEVVMMQVHPPILLMRSLVILVVIISFLSGYSMAIRNQHDWVLGVVFAIVMMGVIFIILHLEYPNIGSLRFDNSKGQLIELRNSM